MKLLAQINGIESPSTIFRENDTFLGDLTSRVLLYAIILAGFYFFVRLLLGGFMLLTSGGDPAKINSGKSSITAATIGLIIVVSTFFIAQILKTVLGINLPV